MVEIHISHDLVEVFVKNFLNNSARIKELEDHTDQQQSDASSLWPICIILACMLLSAVSYIIYLKWPIKR